jgi:hypothetical protein
MKFQIGAMTVGDILDRGLKLLFGRLGTFYTINLIVMLPLLAFQLAMPALGLVGTVDLVAVTASALVVLVLTLILVQIGTAAILHVIGKEFVDEPATIGAALGRAGSVFAPLLGTSLLAGLLIGLGLVACVVPGIIFAIWYAFVSQVVVLEHLSGGAALSRSKELGSGHVGRLFGLIVLLIIISVIIFLGTLGLQYVLPPFSYTTQPSPFGPVKVPTGVIYSNYAINTIVDFLFNALAGSFQAICVTLFYFDLRIRKEGFDLEVAMKQQTL